MRAFHLSLFALLLLVASACSRSGEDSGGSGGDSSKGNQTTSDKKGGDSVEAMPAATIRTSLEPYRAFLDESGRAELDVGGLLIDFGTADQHKYTRGGWRTGWSDNAQDGGTSFVKVTGATATLEGSSRRGGTELVIRARSAVPDQKLAAWVDGVMVGEAAVGTAWQEVRFPVKGVDKAGRRNFILRFRKSGTPRGDVDWMWLAEKAGEKPPAVLPRILPINFSKRSRRALVSPTPRTYSFYLDVPEGESTLVFDYGSNSGAEFRVTVNEDGAEPAVMLKESSKEQWQEAAVPLSKFAGKTIRLDFETVGGKEGLTGWGEPELMIKASPAKAGKAAKAKNAIVIVIDTVRADSFKTVYPDNKVKTPVYDALADKSAAFPNAYNQENWTKPSVATTLSGLYPSTHVTKQDGAKLPDKVTILPQWLKKQGFATAGFVANGYVSGKFGFEKGWDLFRNYIRESKPSEAEYVYGDALEWLKQNKDKRFFLYIQTIDPHVVYRVERDYTKHYFEGEYTGFLGKVITADHQRAMSDKKVKFTDRDLAWLKAMYWGEVTYHDEQMGIFLEELQKLGVMDDTVMVVTNDHGEELHEHGRLGHGHSLYDELVRAPMLWHYPKVFEPGVYKEPVENVDIVPSITELLGIKPMPQAEGQSVVGLARGRSAQRPYYAISEFLDTQRAVRVGNWRFIRTPGNRAHLFNVNDDRQEQTDYLAKDTPNKPIARRLAEVHLGEGLATPDKRQRRNDITARQQFTAGCADLDPATRRQLAALGYISVDCDEEKQN